MKRIFLFLISNFFSPSIIWNFIRYNFFNKHIIRDRGVFVFIYSKSYIELSHGAKIVLHGDLIFNIPEMKYNHKPGYLYMGESSVFEICNSCELLEGSDLQIHSHGSFKVYNFHANIGFELSCGNKIELHGKVTAGRHVRIKDYNGHEVSYEKYPFSSPIIIEDNTWLCTGSTVNPGVHIGSGSVISDNSNVVNDVESSSFVQGNPASVIRSNITFKI